MTFNIDDATKQRLWSKIDVRSDDECWEWTGAFSASGNSGSIHWNPGRTGLSDKVHKAVWQLANGEVPEGKRIKRICSNLRCCNLAHLRLSSGLEERFWSKVAIGEKDECWLWQARIAETGYGQFRPDPKKAHTSAHRVAWELANNQTIPEGKVVLHSCDVRGCCNPSHLSVGTTYDNIHDMIDKGRSNFIPPKTKFGSETNSAKLTEAQVLEIRQLIASGVSYQEIMLRYGISNGLVYSIKNRRSWKHI